MGRVCDTGHKQEYATYCSAPGAICYVRGEHFCAGTVSAARLIRISFGAHGLSAGSPGGVQITVSANNGPFVDFGSIFQSTLSGTGYPGLFGSDVGLFIGPPVMDIAYQRDWSAVGLAAVNGAFANPTYYAPPTMGVNYKVKIEAYSGATLYTVSVA
jgi:hypothetical protein